MTNSSSRQRLKYDCAKRPQSFGVLHVPKLSDVENFTYSRITY